MLDNLLGIADDVALAREEERLTKLRAVELFDDNLLKQWAPGTFGTLAAIHHQLFQDIYAFAGQMRTEDISKGNFRFASVMYLPAALDSIDEMPQKTFAEIVAKYVEMNIAHPFREGNGRSTRIWLDHIMSSSLGKAIDWTQISKEDYLLAMERSPVKDIEIKSLLQAALSEQALERASFMKGIDASYKYEGYAAYTAEGLSGNGGL
ncbi:Fic family protein [Corynebacterium sp. H128]|uniref:protein adenylyltransferase Fic n=1 Tax=Corynebacterium sp. H128 TaxID=3133427 RepID=UPI0030A7D93E